MPEQIEINGESLMIGDIVWWQGQAKMDCEPLPATVISIIGNGTALDIDVHMPGRGLVLKRCVRHIQDPSLRSMTPAAILDCGCWRFRAKNDEQKAVKQRIPRQILSSKDTSSTPALV